MREERASATASTSPGQRRCRDVARVARSAPLGRRCARPLGRLAPSAGSITAAKGQSVFGATSAALICLVFAPFRPLSYLLGVSAYPPGAARTSAAASELTTQDTKPGGSKTARNRPPGASQRSASARARVRLAVKEPDADGEDHVEPALAEVDRLERGDQELGVLEAGVAPGGGGDHLRRAVDRGELRAVLEHVGGRDAVAAADLEHALAGCDVERRRRSRAVARSRALDRPHAALGRPDLDDQERLASSLRPTVETSREVEPEQVRGTVGAGLAVALATSLGVGDLLGDAGELRVAVPTRSGSSVAAVQREARIALQIERLRPPSTSSRSTARRPRTRPRCRRCAASRPCGWWRSSCACARRSARCTRSASAGRGGREFRPGSHGANRAARRGAASRQTSKSINMCAWPTACAS